ncbi:hypothetical protein AAC978_07650 [Desulfitobacterium sp. THU1]|uniref:hypothetical protein n=1 Tax=Desulfitobacterium sp. THU1 TaxID=3138072 RepID=UPI00311DF4DB
MSCLTYYKEGTAFCRECLHSTVDLDLKIADVIFELNVKGYLTSNCCAGHSKESVSYIKFKVDMQEVDVPESFFLDRHNSLEMISYHKAKGITKKKMEQTVSETEYVTYWLRSLEKLRSWANELPIR